MRRRLVRIALFLVIGAIMNVLVAWTIGLLVSPSWRTSNYDIAGDGWPSRAPAGWPDADRWGSSSAFGFDSHSATTNINELARTRRQDPSVVLHFMAVYEYGLPARSVTCRRLVIQRGGRQAWDWDESPLKRGIEASLFGYDVPYRRIAFRPLWLGFTFNTVFYATLAAALVWLIGEVRRRLRVRRGQCTNCGYDLAGLVDCPECGTASPKAIQEAE